MSIVHDCVGVQLPSCWMSLELCTVHTGKADLLLVLDVLNDLVELTQGR